MNHKYLFLLLFTCISMAACDERAETSQLPEEPKDSVHFTNTDTIISKSPARIYDYDTTAWTDILYEDTGILLDIKYATSDNFVKRQLYECPRCLLRPEVADAVIAVHQQLQQQGLGLKVFDCYRPRPVQEALWEIMPNASYVTPPERGSMHNKGAAVDLTIVDADGRELDMGTSFDFFGPRAHHTYTELSEEILNNRKLLREAMAAESLVHIRTEWWHYSFASRAYELSDMLWNCDDLNLEASRNKAID